VRAICLLLNGVRILSGRNLNYICSKYIKVVCRSSFKIYFLFIVVLSAGPYFYFGNNSASDICYAVHALLNFSVGAAIVSSFFETANISFEMES